MPIGDLLAQITGEPTSNPTHGTSRDMLTPVKRKPEDQTRKLANSSQTSTSSANRSRNLGSLNRPVPLNSSPQKRQNRNVPSAADRNLPASNNNQMSPIITSGPSKPPKKGSYAEIMARGKAAHATLGQVGKIMHKNIERPPSKRERDEMKIQKSHKLQKNLTPSSKNQKSGFSKSRDAEKCVPEPPKKIKKAALATTGYTGTARPKSSNLSKTSRLSEVKTAQKNFDQNRSSSGPRYRRRIDDYDEDDEEEEEDYETDLSDMEAAAFEVDEEEETAAKIARREDAEALAEENRLRREKEAKRRRLTSMT
ncbi:putative chromatin spt2 [Golovinomyces cichoracearum]|uniref:Putative chromatin spt2 n=1 Tax=Golovinomyces cichoracearum TaxID=62708 RepID=A0A420ILI2_9PEZI|nr:putative chromatin spt2 [Golovinomyces cichoracearum]